MKNFFLGLNLVFLLGSAASFAADVVEQTAAGADKAGFAELGYDMMKILKKDNSSLDNEKKRTFMVMLLRLVTNPMKPGSVEVGLVGRSFSTSILGVAAEHIIEVNDTEGKMLSAWRKKGFTTEQAKSCASYLDSLAIEYQAYSGAPFVEALMTRYGEEAEASAGHSSDESSN